MATPQPASKYEQEQRPFEARGGNLVQYVKDLFEQFHTSRRPYEEIWERSTYDFLGQYQPERRWRPKVEGKGHRSKIFVRLTALKCNTAHSKIIDALFAGTTKVPFDVEPLDSEKMGMPPEMAKQLAQKFKKRLEDHFKDIELEEKYDDAILECAMLGSAVFKGPLVESRRRTQVIPRTVGGLPVSQFGGSINPYEIRETFEQIPTVEHAPLWEIYFDANARRFEDSIGVIHFRRLLPQEFRALARLGGFDRDSVYEAARRASNTHEKDTRYIQMGETYMGEQGTKDQRVSAVEYWGLVPVKMLREADVEVPEDRDDEESIEALVFIGADGILCKACLSPLPRRPFYLAPFKKRPHQVYGTGVPEMMRDSQQMVNSAARIFVDNKAIAGNLMVGVNKDRIDTKRTGDLSIYPGKVWYVKGNNAPKDAIDAITFPDVSSGLREMIELFERFSDEETGIPKYTSGQQDTFLNKTAAGMSMLMTQANINLKSVIKNIDNFWTEPVVEAFYEWFLSFADQAQGMVIPLRVKATGSDSMIAKELKMENLMKFMQVTSAPQDAIFLDRIALMKEIARILEVENVMRNDDEIKGLMARMQEQADQPKDLREIVAVDRIYPMLTRKEQMQILEQLGITPDPDGVPQSAVEKGVDAAGKVAAANAKARALPAERAGAAVQ
jgi:hypothetical protein